LRIFSPNLGRYGAGRWLALGVLAMANLGLLAVVSGGVGSLSDVIAPFTGHLIGFGLAAGLALLVRGSIVTLLAGGMAATFAAHATLGLVRCCEAPAPAAVSAPGRITSLAAGQSLTVLTLNTWHGHGDVERIEHYLATAPADVIVLSEFDASKHALLESLKGVYPHQVECTSEPPCSLVILSRLPFEASGAAHIAAGTPAFVWARLDAANGGPTTIIGTHLYRPSSNPWRHELQMKELAQFIRRIDGPLVLAGSLNTSPWSQSFRALRIAGLVPTGILMPSWPAWPIVLPQVALDHIFVSQDLAVAAAGTGPAVGSDHLPVWAKLDRQPLAAYRGRTRSGSRLAAAGLHLGGEFLGDLGGEHGGARDLGR
jgi:endonuclease/exonuclease/phosphatase (EEP) superfamily protein YafD